MKTPLITAALLALMTAACGGHQSPYDSTTLSFASVEAAVPGDATYAIVVDLDAESYDAANQSVAQNMDVSGLWGEWLGVEEGTGDVFADSGIDTDGGYAVFSRGISPVIVARLSDGALWDHTIDGIIDHNPDLDWGHREVVGTNFDYAATEHGTVLLGTRGDYAVARVGLGETGLDEAAADLEGLFYGYGDVGLFTDTEAYSTILGREQEGETLYSYAYGETTALSQLFGVLKNAAQAMDDASTPFPTGAASAPTGPAQVCDAAEERMTTNYQWMGGAAFTQPDDLLASRSEVMVSLTQAHAERLGELLGGAVQLERGSIDDAALYIAGHADLRGIVDSFAADPMAASCNNLGMLPGMGAMLSQSMGPTIDYNLQYFNGDFAVALLDVEMAGFLPFVHGALMLGSPNPAALATQLGRRLEAQGASVNPTMGPDGPIYEYRLLHLRINTYIYEDRLVMVVGNVPEEITSRLATAPMGEAGVPFGELSWNGARMGNLIDIALEFAAASGSFSADQLNSTETGLAGVRAIEQMHGTAHFEGNMLYLEGFQRLFAPEE